MPTIVCVIGLDVGTQGARAAAISPGGEVLAEASVPFVDANLPVPEPRAEQRPEAWWEASVRCLRSVADELSGYDVRAISVDSTSGTFLPVSADGTPLRPAIMYNDGRAGAAIADEVQGAGREIADKLGYRFPPAFALPKMLWLKRNEPEAFDRAAKLLHAADYIVGRLSGRFDVSDSSNALKTGFDLCESCWPAFIESRLGIALSKLPDVVAPGTAVGHVTSAASAETGLATQVAVIAGCTDGTAAFLASGACAPGEWNAVLGTTLVLRGVSSHIIRDPMGRYYCHRHPEGAWLPGGASNVGGECLVRLYRDADLSALDSACVSRLPTGLAVYPLVRKGERAPFVSSTAEGFVIGTPVDDAERYAGYLEGVALVERWCLATLEDLGAPVGPTIHATGGGSRSDVWLQVRADVTQRRLVRPCVADAMMGAALLAASHTLFDSLSDATRAMVRPQTVVHPREGLASAYEDKLGRLIEECAARGY